MSPHVVVAKGQRKGQRRKQQRAPSKRPEDRPLRVVRAHFGPGVNPKTGAVMLPETYMTAAAFCDWMARHGWSQAVLATRIRTSVRSVQRWRSGAAPIGGLASRALAWALQNTPLPDRSAGPEPE